MTSDLTHYIIVRRDLPFGVACAQIAHAAGESFFAFGCTVSSVGQSAPAPDHESCAAGLTAGAGEVGGSSPSRCSSSFDPSRTKVVILAARDERHLTALRRKLYARGVRYVTIEEPDEPYLGQLMALGLLPSEPSSELRSALNGYQMLRRLDESLPVP